MPTAEIITIGTELLLGEIQDTNTQYLARTLRDYGIDLFRTMTVGDNAQRIALSIQEALTRSDIIITTGGLGPTVDDPTRQAIAQALSVDLEYHPELWDQILARFKRFNRVPGENNKRQAFIPQGAIPVENPVGTAPAFIYERNHQSIISLPGVPKEMEYLMLHAVLPYLRQHFQLQGMIKASVIHTASIGESQVDELVGDLEILTNPTVGLLAHPGQVDLRITAKANDEAEADQMIADMKQIIQERLGPYIFGQDEENLDNLVIQAIESRHWSLNIFEAGTSGELTRRLSTGSQLDIISQIQSNSLSEADLAAAFDRQLAAHPSEAAVAVSLTRSNMKLDITILTHINQNRQMMSKSYGGPAQHGPDWAANTAMDFLRAGLSNAN